MAQAPEVAFWNVHFPKRSKDLSGIFASRQSEIRAAQVNGAEPPPCFGVPMAWKPFCRPAPSWLGLALTCIDCCTNCCYLPSLLPAPGNLSVVLLVVETIGGKLNAGFILLIFWRHVVLKWSVLKIPWWTPWNASTLMSSYSYTKFNIFQVIIITFLFGSPGSKNWLNLTKKLGDHT